MPDDHSIGLATLLTTMGLTPYLYPPDTSPQRLHQRLVDIVTARDDGTLSNVIKAINPAA